MKKEKPIKNCPYLGNCKPDCMMDNQKNFKKCDIFQNVEKITNLPLSFALAKSRIKSIYKENEKTKT